MGARLRSDEARVTAWGARPHAPWTPGRPSSWVRKWVRRLPATPASALPKQMKSSKGIPSTRTNRNLAMTGSRLGTKRATATLCEMGSLGRPSCEPLTLCRTPVSNRRVAGATGRAGGATGPTGNQALTGRFLACQVSRGMLNTKSLVELAGFVAMVAAAAILLHDLYRLYMQSELILHNQPRPEVVALRYRAAGPLAVLAFAAEVLAATWSR